MFCIALTTSLPKEYLKQANLVVDAVGEIMDLVDHSCAAKNAKDI
jgi:hypothetical protein